jgi:hypothetical protein
MSLARFLASHAIAASAMLAMASIASAQVAIGYTFSQTLGAYVPITGGTQIGVVSGTTGAASIDDVVFPVTLPFAFTFDSAPQTQINVSSNGFLTFGATAPSTTSYTPISATTAYAGAVSPFGRDLQSGFGFAADRVLGTNTLMNVTSLGPIQVGDFLAGTGIATGATVAAISGTTITMSANATSTAAAGGVSAHGPWSEIRHETLGSSPNRTFVVQWSNFKRFGQVLTTVQHMQLNFQVRLEEATGNVEVVYGNCSPGLATLTTVNEVGLRGPTNAFATNVNNRRNVKGTNDDWINSLVGMANTSGMVFNNVTPANVISNGLTYRWTPALVASNVSYGTGCYTQPRDSFYQYFASSAAAATALTNTSYSMAFTGSGYVVTNGGPSYVAPGGGATTLALTDDSDASTPALTTSFPYIGGAAASLRVCSNGFVSVGTGNGTAFAPAAAAFLSAPLTAWWSWHDFNPAAAGSGAVKFEEVGSMVYITWDGVYTFSGTTAADANTLQFQFNTANGDVGVVFNSVSPSPGTSTGSNLWLVGYSTGGPNLDPGSMDLATGLPIVTGPDLYALALAAAPRPVLGTTYTYTVSNIPAGSVISALLLSLVQGNVDMTGMGAPGCFQLVDLSLASTSLLFGGPTATYPVALPSNLALIGLKFHGQAASLVSSANALGVITSNGMRSTISDL